MRGGARFGHSARMQVVNFTFRSGTSPQTRAAALSQVSSWPEVWKVKALDPNDEAVARLAYLYVKDGHDPQAVVRQLNQMPDVESADLPAERRLIR